MTKPNDTYQWRIVYRDGSVTDEYDPDHPGGRGFAEREAKPIKAIKLLPIDVWSFHQWNLNYTVQIPVNAEPIFFRRRTVTINLNDDTETPEPTKHCIGWQRGDEAVYLFVLDDGSTLLTNNLNAI